MDNLDFGLWMTAMGMGTVFLLLIVLMLVLPNGLLSLGSLRRGK